MKIDVKHISLKSEKVTNKQKVMMELIKKIQRLQEGMKTLQ